MAGGLFLRWGTSFLSGGGAPLGGIGFDGGGLQKDCWMGERRPSKINKPENQKIKILFLGSNEKQNAGKEQGQD